MSEAIEEAKITFKDELYDQYNWFRECFLTSLQKSCGEFFNDSFSLRLISISKNMNILFQGDDYFVTKIRIDKQHDVLFRSSAQAIKIILDRLFGEIQNFDLAEITELEAKIISSFNDYLYKNISPFLLIPAQKNQKRKNLDTIHLTFFIKDKKSEESAKLIVSIPQVLLSPSKLNIGKQSFNVSDFKTSQVSVNIKVGTTKFLLKELKTLEKEDIVVFDNSNIHSMKLIYEDYEKEFQIAPNPGLVTSIDNGGNNMTNEKPLSQSLWDNIQVEMGAEFDKVKITLGELKNIEEGLVVDISSVYNNKVSLKVENKVIAKGELIIINDRYGVRIDEVFASDKEQAEKITEANDQIQVENPTSEAPQAVEDNTSSDEEFDYSDFELDNQDI